MKKVLGNELTETDIPAIWRKEWEEQEYNDLMFESWKLGEINYPDKY